MLHLVFGFADVSKQVVAMLAGDLPHDFRLVAAFRNRVFCAAKS
jgi:hypothetical protein